MTSNSRRNRRKIIRAFAWAAGRPTPAPFAVRIHKPINDRTTVLDTAREYVAVEVKPDSRMGKMLTKMGYPLWIDKLVTTQVTSARIPDHRVINNDTTRRVISRSAFSSSRRLPLAHPAHA